MKKKSWETCSGKCSQRNSNNSRPTTTKCSSRNKSPLCKRSSISRDGCVRDDWSPSPISASESSDISDSGGGGGGGGMETLLSFGGIKMRKSVNCPHQKLGGTTLLNSKVNVLVQILAILLATFSTIPTVEGIGKPIPTIDIQSVEKGTANLPCDISLPEPHDPTDDVMLVLWYREDLGRPIYSVDSRDRPFNEAERWSDENVFGNRAYFRLSSRPAILAIENVVEGDAAVYRCRVDFRLAQTRNVKVNLTVIVPPKDPVIVDETGSERTIFVGPYTEGSALTLHCLVEGGSPLPRVVWYRNGKLIDTSDYFADGLVKNDLTITVLARSDLSAELTCEASNNNISRPLATTVHLDMNFSPLEVTILGKSSRITAGKKYDLMCQSVGSRPPAHIWWFLDDKRVESAKETTSKDGNTTTSTLSLIPKKEDSGKYLSCRAENSIIPSKVLEDGWELVIQYMPEARLQLGSSLSGSFIKESSDVYFDCLISAFPVVSQVNWRHNGKMLYHNISAGIIMTNQSLVLQRVTRLSAGNYSCIGRNSEGEGSSPPFYLDVLYAPSCKPNQIRVHGVAKLENANITCDVDANPQKVQFRWSFNNSAESLEVPSQRFSVGTRSVVTYTPMTELDYGTLLCWASNKIGDQRVPCVYHVIAAGRPDTVHNCTVANHSTDSFFLYCTEGFNGGLPQSFILELRESQSDKLKANLTSHVPAFAVAGLEPGFTFTASVYAFNNKGRSEAASVTVYTMRLPEKILTREKEIPRSSAHFQLSPTVSILIGVLTALSIVSIVILLLRVYCTRRRSHDRRRRDKAATTPLKIDAPDGCDADEKNPDVIPQDPDEVEYYRKRQQHISVSTIDTSSPARVTPGGLPNYCTLRNGGIPLQDLNNIGTHIGTRPNFMGPEYGSPGFGACPTLPRHHHGHGLSTNVSASTHPQHMLVDSTCITGHMEWPTYVGREGRQQRLIGGPTNIPPPPHLPGGQNPRALSTFHRTSSPAGISSQSASTQLNAYDMPPLLQIPTLEEESETISELPLMQDKIESTV
ncbi:protein turtle isoform X2 [Folsomia candida]|uniref:protein turtle isoform X2 n=1 Tax=Folsomia candida TaxID=158441 RepID=UPI00160500FA|nr:protein turtle isoform X2 [Folsomia candida]